MTYPPEGPRSQGPGSQGPASSGYGSYGPGGQSYGSHPQGQPQYGQGQPPPQQQSTQHQSPQQPSQQAPSQQYNPPLAGDSSSLPRILALVVLALGVVNFLTGLAGQYYAFGSSNSFFVSATGDPTSVALLLAAGLVAGVGLLPKQSTTIGIAAALSVAGWLVLVFQSFNTGETSASMMAIDLGIGAKVILVSGFLQSVAAIFATLASAGVVKAPRPKPNSYGQQNNFPGYGQQQQPGTYGQQAPSYGYSQPQQQTYGGGYVPPTYTGQAPQNQNQNQNTTGGLGYPVGNQNQDPQQGGQQYGQYQYGQPPVGSGGYGAAQHAAPQESAPSDQGRPEPRMTEPRTSEPQGDQPDDNSGDSVPPYNAPTHAFEATPDDDKK